MIKFGTLSNHQLHHNECFIFSRPEPGKKVPATLYTLFYDTSLFAKGESRQSSPATEF